MKCHLLQEKVGLVKTVVLLLTAFYLLLVLVYCIPSSFMTNNVLESYQIISKEGLYPISYADGHSYDNYTVSIMLNEALNAESNPFVAAIETKYCTGENQIEGLKNALEGEKADDSYFRYWHGYLVFLKPMLVFFNIYQIRLICQIIVLILLMFTGNELKQMFGNNGIWAIIALAISLGMYSGINAAMTLPLFSSFAISLLGSIYILKIYKVKIYDTMIVFFVLGACTVFFDFLDNPILTLGMPLCMLVMKWNFLNKKKKIPSLMKIGFYACFYWGAGYIVLWVAKWILAAVLLGHKSFVSIGNQVAFRLGKGEAAEQYLSTPWMAIQKNITSSGAFLTKSMFGIALVCIICIIIILVLYFKLQLKENFEMMKIIQTVVGFTVISILPFAWYMVLNNHSVIHADFITYRNLLLSMYALLLLVGYEIYYIINWRKVRNG